MVLTGGEPMLQSPQILAIAAVMVENERLVQIETHCHYGEPLLSGLLKTGAVVVASPKLPSSKNPCPRKSWVEIGRAATKAGMQTEVEQMLFLKLVIGDEQDVPWVEEAAGAFPVFVQPASGSEPALDICMKLIHRIPFLQLSVQTHKFLALP